MKKMYVIVRSDLGNSYKMVQGTHALAKYSLEHESLFKEWNNNFLIFLEVKNIFKLFNIMNKLNYLNIAYSYFEEPDLNNEITSLSIYCEENIFKNINLVI